MQYQEAAGGAAAGVGFRGIEVADHLEGMVAGGVRATSYADYKIIRRNGAVVAFEPSKIAVATSDTSARVGTGAVIIDSSICVATTTGLPARRAVRVAGL